MKLKDNLVKPLSEAFRLGQDMLETFSFMELTTFTDTLYCYFFEGI